MSIVTESLNYIKNQIKITFIKSTTVKDIGLVNHFGIWYTKEWLQDQFKRKIRFISLTIVRDFNLIKYFGIWYGIADFFSSLILRGPFSFLGRRMKRLYYNKAYSDIKNMKPFTELIYKYKNIKIPLDEIRKDSPIWVFWWQGFNASDLPEIVKVCVESIEANSDRHPIKYITKDNFNQYSQIPQLIIDKFMQKKMTITHFSDILRLDLLSRHGGIWIDATVFLANKLPEYMYNYSFFTIKHGQFPMHISEGRWTGFFLASCPNHPFIQFSRDYLFEYWKKENMLICYLLIDVAFSTAFDEFEWAKRIVKEVPESNKNIFDLESKLNDIYDDYEMKHMFETCSIFKLSYKKYLSHKENTYFIHLKNYYKNMND